MRSMCRSIANRLCGAPKPRNAPCGGALVATPSRGCDAGPVIGAAGMNRAAREYHRGQASVRSAVDRKFDLSAENLAVLR